MPARKDDESLFSRIKRFVANPTTDWAELNSRQDPAGPDAQKSEIREMVERKRRNDFVRKRELDMLRRIRREGLGPEQVAALGNLSQIDDAESRPSDPAARADSGVKAKIDAIEQQMVGPGTSTSAVAGAMARHPSGFFDAPTEPAAFRAAPGGGLLPASPAATPAAASVRAALPPLSGPGGLDPATAPTAPLPLAAPAAAPVPPPAPLAPAPAGDLQHDPDLDEAVIAFANADFDQCERAIVALTGPGGRRAQDAQTWLARFDLYRATGQQDPFEALAVEYAQRFGLSAPQWYSLPRLVADAVAAQQPQQRAGAGAGADAGAAAGWVCPRLLDSEALARLRAQSLQMPLPWVLDWSAVERVEPDAAAHLSVLLRHWATQTLEMHWRQGARLLAVLAAQSPTGVRDADPAFWVTRLDVLRLANRPDQFDETAIDYCVTYEVSPPSWERARCTLQFVDGVVEAAAGSAASSVASTSFVESSILDEVDGAGRIAQVDLSGQLIGGIGTTLDQLDAQIGDAVHLHINCARLIRVDFLAAGDLLNWVLAKRAQGREVSFVDMHRLVGLFFGAMGINEHARVRARRV